MSLDELIQSINAFKSGVSEYQVTQAANDAQKKLADVNATVKDEGERFKQTQAIGQDLALRMTAANAAPDKISAVVQGLVPSASMAAQNTATQGVEGMKTKSQMDIEKLKAETQLQTHQMTLDAALGKNRVKEVADAQSKFEKLPEVQPLLKAIPTLQDASDKMHENAGQYGSTAITNLVKMGVIKASVQRVTEKEIAAANETPSAWANLQKNIGIQVKGEAPKNVQDFWTKIVDSQLDNTKKQLVKHVGSYAQSNPNLDSNDLKQRLLLRHNLTEAASSAAPSSSSADVQAALDWLASDAGSQASPAVQQQVRAKIKELRGGK